MSRHKEGNIFLVWTPTKIAWFPITPDIEICRFSGPRFYNLILSQIGMALCSHSPKAASAPAVSTYINIDERICIIDNCLCLSRTNNYLFAMTSLDIRLEDIPSLVSKKVILTGTYTLCNCSFSTDTSNPI